MSKNIKIGNLKLSHPVFPAPMAGLTDPPFRKLIDEFGCIGAVFTEMISIEGLIRKNEQTLKMIKDFSSAFPRFIQLFGSNPDSFAESVKIVEGETDFQGIDINMGCPVKKVVKKGGGSYLLTQPEKIGIIIKKIKKVSDLPLTIKIRIGYNRINILETAKIIEESGADGLIVHFRLRKQKFSGEPLWEYAEKIREIIKIPLIGNGDINNISIAEKRLKQTDGIMIGRAMLANPSIFREIAKKRKIGDKKIIKRFIELMEDFYPEDKLSPRIKAFLRYFLKGTDFPKKLKTKIFHCKNYKEIKKEILEYFI